MNLNRQQASTTFCLSRLLFKSIFCHDAKDTCKTNLQKTEANDTSRELLEDLLVDVTIKYTCQPSPAT